MQFEKVEPLPDLSGRARIESVFILRTAVKPRDSVLRVD